MTSSSAGDASGREPAADGTRLLQTGELCQEGGASEETGGQIVRERRMEKMGGGGGRGGGGGEEGRREGGNVGGERWRGGREMKEEGWE